MAGSEATEVASAQSVVIIGRPSLQNAFLASLIDSRTGCPCLVRTLEDLNGQPRAALTLVMLDVEGASEREIGLGLRSLSESDACHSIAVINADADIGFEKIVSWPKVKGVFWRETSQEHFIRGIQAIFNSECWLPRKMLAAYLEQMRPSRPPSLPDSTHLTRKEIETLKLIAGGNSNSHIARQLNVSPHTVKTHIYNLFRKIHVSNRVQAVHWASRNMVLADAPGQPQPQR